MVKVQHDAGARRRTTPTEVVSAGVLVAGLCLFACTSPGSSPDTAVLMTPAGVTQGSSPPPRPVLEQMIRLPSSLPERVPAGFTITGMTRITAGDHAGRWLVSGGSGRLIEGDDSPYAAAVHILSTDFATIVRTFDFSNEGAVSVQGLAYRAADDTFFAAFNGVKQVRHFRLDGEELVANRIVFPIDGLDWEPNAFGFEPDLNQLFVANRIGDTVVRVHADASAAASTGSRLVAGSAFLLAVEGRSTANSPDHFHYDRASGTLFYSVGQNGAPGEVRARTGWTTRSPVGRDLLTFGPLAEAQAIEGIYIDADAGRLYVANDGGFHTQAVPPENLVIVYALKSPASE